MSKIFGALLTLLILCLPSSEAAGKPGYCHDFGIDIKEGESVPAPNGRCAHLTCRNAELNLVAAQPCGLIHIPQGCRFAEEDLTKPYPDCCAKAVCD